MQQRLKRIICAALLAVAAAPQLINHLTQAAAAQEKSAPPAVPGPSADRFDLIVREDIFAGMAGDAARFKKGMKLCEEALAKNPNHPEALVWHGGGLLFEGGQAFQQGDSQKGGELWQRGRAEQDRAVSLAPDNIAVLIPRAASLFGAAQNVPVKAIADELLTIAVNDYEKTLRLQQSYFDKLSAHARAELLIALAAGWHKLGKPDNARAYFLRLTKEMPGTAHAKTAQTWLEKQTLPARINCVGCHA